MSNGLVLIGAGNMGAAIARGMLRTGTANLRIVDPDPSKLEEFASLGVHVGTTCTGLAPKDLMLAIPPQAFPAFAREARWAQAHPWLVLSVMAGVRIANIQRALQVRYVVRTIPNTPAAVFEGMTIFCKSGSVDEALTHSTRRVLESFGRCAEVSDEALIDPATALCGGGPAFVAYFAHALQQFGVCAGIDESVARSTVVQLLRGTAELLDASGKPLLQLCRDVKLLRGTAELLDASGKPLLQLCRDVMTPGGTTERGIEHFDRTALTQTVMEALKQSTARSLELGEMATATFDMEQTRC